MANQFFIITGLSGAGKSQTLKILEDMGFFCVDNLPVALVPSFADFCVKSGGKLNKVALGIDIRAGTTSLASLDKVLSEVRARGIKYRIIFFTANDSTLLQRYSETRRRHPLGRRVISGIQKERRMMAKILAIADQEIDTSHLTLGELKEVIARLLGIQNIRKIKISMLSFGYKYGIPIDADLVIDVRFLPNPNYIPEMRSKTGLDSAVRKYVQRQKATKEFFGRFFGLIDFLLPRYIREGKTYLTIAVGCTGGHHRSVVVAESIGQYLRKKNFPVQTYHRDIERGVEAFK